MTPPRWRELLYQELDAWNYAGVAATFWWRDDDARADSNALTRLLQLSRDYDAPLALAVIPYGLQPDLATAMQAADGVTILQHGFAHTNHAPAANKKIAKKIELGHRPAAEIYAELTRGFEILRRQFAARFLPVLTPPWNRIAAPLLDGLADIGFIGISTYGARAARDAADGIRAVNTHMDIIDWRNNKEFIGADAVAKMLVAHLRGKRVGELDAAEPTGLLTHHLVHDDACWNFLAELLAALDKHPAAQWQTAQDAFNY